MPRTERGPTPPRPTRSERATPPDPRSNASTAGSAGEPARITVLAVDDNRSDLDLLGRLVRGVPTWRIELRMAHDAPAALVVLRDEPVDVVLADFRLGAIDGIQLLEAARAQGYRGAYVLLAGAGDERTVARAMRAGAAGYVPKDDLDGPNLERVLANAIERTRLETELEDQRGRLAAANRDLELRNLEIGRFSHVLSHELKSPLTAARLFLSNLAEGRAGPLTTTQSEYLRFVKESCDRMRVCLNAVLDVTQLETGRLSLRPARHDLGELARGTVAGFEDRARESSIALSVDVAPGLPEAWVDGHRIGQVLGNLVDNALKFTLPGGTVTVEVGAHPADAARLRVAVADTGAGIPPEFRASLFERPHQVLDGSESWRIGLGLSLFLCREIVRLHGEEISVESEVNRGTTFAFTCPTTPFGTGSDDERT